MGIITKVVDRAMQEVLSALKKDKKYQIGDIEIDLPADHKLPLYQRQYKMYDIKLGDIANIVFRKHPYSICIDIGANVGDSAAIIRSKSGVPIVCIEGDEAFYDYLDSNTKRMENVTIIQAFVGDTDGDIKKKIHRVNVTGRFLENENSFAKIRRLTTILNEEDISFEKLRLLKIDTDGFDFDIITGNMDAITESKCNLFFEYEVSEEVSYNKSLNVISLLAGCGYQFIVYDNYGQMITYIDKTNCINRFVEINNYLIASNRYGGGIKYADVFASLESDIIDELLLLEKDLVKFL